LSAPPDLTLRSTIRRSADNNIVIPLPISDLNNPSAEIAGRPKELLRFTIEGKQHLMWSIAILNTMMRITACAKGRVQGVGYRYLVTDCARETNVAGFVKNVSDGSVLIIAEGSDGAVSEFIRMVRAQGDPVIRVDTLEVTKSKPTGEFSGFGIRW
jgi:acylphosphatase